MLKDIAVRYYTVENYNCAESMLHAGNEYYGLGLGENEMRLVSAFGGGIQTGSVCGLLLSAASILSMRYVETRAHDSKEIKPVVKMLTERFTERLGSMLCCEIKPVYFNKEARCQTAVEAACDILEKVIADFEAERA